MVRARLGSFENIPTADAEVIAAFINEAVRDISKKLRPTKTCFRNTDAISAPTGTSDVLQNGVFSVDCTQGSTHENPNKTFLSMISLTLTEGTTTYKLTERPAHEVLHSRQELFDSITRTPTSFAVINRAGFEFNVHIWPCPNGIQALGLEGWYYYIPGPATHENDRLEISDEYVDLVWPYVLHLLTGGSKQQFWNGQYKQQMAETRASQIPDGQSYIPPLEGL
jgi:hypothetical protein